MQADARHAGVWLDAGDRRILLKWHKLRRFAGEPPFAIENLRRGLAAGASLEIDVRALGDGHWVCLHDDVLDEETTGHGPVDESDVASIRNVRVAGSDYAPPLLTEIAEGVAKAPPTGACLQLDLKQPGARLPRQTIERFAESIAPIAERCLLSGTEWEAVRTLGSAVPGLRLGFDPLDLAEGRQFGGAADIAAFVEEVAATAPAAVTFYLHHRFVMRATEAGFNPVARLKATGATVDVWTLDPTTPGIDRILPWIVAAGADQITTNAPIEMAQLWEQLRSGLPGGTS